jgi:hypothetical protein
MRLKRIIQAFFIGLICILSIGNAVAQSWGSTSTSNQMSRTYIWYYGGYKFTQTLTFKESDYNYYRSLSKASPYSEYATQHDSYRYLEQIAAKLDEDAADLGYTGIKLVEYLVAFVQQTIIYTPDPTIYEYPKYPIESLVEQKGDCEDKAALLVALLKTFGFDAIMVNLPGHMAAAVACDNCGGYYNHNGRKYSFIETTQPNWKIGQLTALSSNNSAKLLDIRKTASYSRTTTPKPDNIYAYNTDKPSVPKIIPNTTHLWNQNQGSTNTYKISYSDNGTNIYVSGSGNSHVTIIVNGKTIINQTF